MFGGGWAPTGPSAGPWGSLVHNLKTALLEGRPIVERRQAGVGFGPSFGEYVKA